MYIINEMCSLHGGSMEFERINPFSPRPAKTGHFIILLCLLLDNFTCLGRASGWERVKWLILNLSFLCQVRFKYTKSENIMLPYTSFKKKTALSHLK